jgi:hypothetical protein
MPTVFLCPTSAIFQWFNDVGIVLSGGKINTYIAGTTNPTATYTDSTGVTPNSNPIILGSNGRLSSVQIWQPQGVLLKIVITDANNNQLGPVFDQIVGINDPSAIQNLYSSNAAGSGADLVANAMRSYGVLTDIRAGISSSIPGSTLIVRSEGLLGVNDGYGGLYYWNSSSIATDDGYTVIKPTGTSGAGRYLLLRGGAPAIYIAKQTTTSRASTTTLSTDPELVFTTLPNAPTVTWAFEACLMFNGVGGGGGGIALTLQGTGSVPTNNNQNLATGLVNGVSFVGRSSWVNSGSPSAQISAATITAAGSGNDILYISGTISLGITGGNFGIAWAQNTSSGNACAMLAGSWIRLSVAK